MILTPRINLKSIPYSYLEGTIDTSVETDIGVAIGDFVNYALALEQAAEEFGFKPEMRPMEREAVNQGAVPIKNDGARNDVPTPRMDQGEPCQLCGQPGKWETTKTGKRVLKCAGACKDEVNGKFYAHTVRWA